jgi:hypothetical protein
VRQAAKSSSMPSYQCDYGCGSIVSTKFGLYGWLWCGCVAFFFFFGGFEEEEALIKNQLLSRF